MHRILNNDCLRLEICTTTFKDSRVLSNKEFFFSKMIKDKCYEYLQI
jgi:hypothetical protein